LVALRALTIGEQPEPAAVQELLSEKKRFSGSLI
jgi:hypothetical protein